MAYKILLDNKQKEYIFSKTDCINKQKKIMSVWSYVIKHQDKNLSTNKLYAMYRRYHLGISKAYFYQLVEIIQNYNPNVETNVETNVEIEKPLENKEISEVDKDNNLPKNKDLNLSFNTYTLYTNEVCSPMELICKAMELLKDLGIKSKVVRENVFLKLKQCTHINKKGMVNYILKVIQEKKEQNEIKRENYRKNKPYAPKNLRFNNFEGRDRSENNSQGNMSHSEIEKKLLGWA